MNNNVLVIEFTPSGIRMVLGYKFHKKIFILKAVSSPSISLDMNGFLEKNSCYEAISKGILQIKQDFKEEDIFSNLIVLLPSDDFSLLRSQGEAITSDPSSLIVQNDYQNCINNCNMSINVGGKVVVYNEPIEFKDGFLHSYNEFPLGIKSEKLTVKFDVMLTNNVLYNHYMSIISEIGLNAKLVLFSAVGGTHFVSTFASIENYLQLEIDDMHSILSLINEKRVVKSYSLKKGNDYAINEASKFISVDFDYMKKISLASGLSSSLSYDYLDKYNHKVSDYSKALEYGYKSYLSDISNYIKSLNVPVTVPIVLYGDAYSIYSLDVFLQNQLSRQIFVFESKVIGARGSKYINCLGAINISNYSYISLSHKKNNSNVSFDLRG